MLGRNACLFVVLGTCTLGCAPTDDRGAAPTTGFVNKVHHGWGSDAKYVVFVPHAYDARQEYPAILFLHGLGQSGDDGKVQAERGLGQAIRERERTFPFIAIFPQSQEKSWQAHSADGSRAMRILDEVRNEYRVDDSRIYLTGYSMGGEGVWSLAAADPPRWAAIVPICPGGDLQLATRLKDVPCWCFQGDADDTSTVNQTRAMLRAIKVAGGRPMYHEYPGVGHNCWDLTYAHPGLYEWLAMQKRP